MAFTIEAALVVPVSIGIIALAASLSLPAYLKVRQTAVLGAAVSSYSEGTRHLYKTFELGKDNESSIGLETSPSILIDLYELSNDIYRTISGNSANEPQMNLVECTVNNECTFLPWQVIESKYTKIVKC